MIAAESFSGDSPWSGVARALGEALLLTLGQIFLACAVGTYRDGAVNLTPRNLAQSYVKLVQFDSQWYWCIAQDGYHTDRVFQEGKVGNVAFFPGYPLLVRGVHRATGLPWEVCLLLVSQAACWGFWTYFFLILDRAEVPPMQSRLAALFLANQPAAFFLVAGYSESLFLFGLCGYIYGTDGDRADQRWLGALFGVLMTATRIVGLPLVLYPVIRDYFRPEETGWWRRMAGSLAIALVASLGALGFFTYCERCAGSWNAYMTAQERGWNVRSEYLAIASAKTYLIDVDAWQIDGFLSPDWLSQAAVPLFVAIFIGLILIETHIAISFPSPTTAERVGYSLIAIAMFYLATAAMFGNQYRSMIRYVFCSEALLAVHVLHLLNHEDVQPGWGTAAAVWLVMIPCAVVQGAFIHRFVNGLWVA